MSDEQGCLVKDAFVILTKGEYSDYRVLGAFRALSDLDLPALVAAFLEEHPGQQAEDRFNPCDLGRWLVKHKHLVLAPAFEWYLGDYYGPCDSASELGYFNPAGAKDTDPE